MKKFVFVPLLILAFLLTSPPVSASNQASARAESARPNIVLILSDNLGIGEVGVYGGARGVPTPTLDGLAGQGVRFTNFNVEYHCVVSRIALLTGRYGLRTGDGLTEGMTLWEVTIAEALRSIGYATGIYGKWHVGGDNWKGRREPTQQGFDEWYGIPGTSHTTQFTSFEGFDTARNEVPYIWEAKAGELSRQVKPYNLETRRTIDREAAERGIAFMERNVKAGKPFFFFYPMTQIHFPTLPHPDKAGTTGAGDIGDAMADMDYNVGLVLESLERLGIAENTFLIFCGDNGAELRRPWRGAAGPWRGYYNSALEGGIRTPCLIRWPGRIPPGRVSNDVIHEIDLFPTIAAAVGAPEIVPKDRPIDGVNQLPFLEGKQVRSGRNSVLFIARESHIMAVKWHDWKLWYHYQTELPDPEPDNLLRLYDLRVDPREEIDVKDYFPWVISVMDGIVAEYEASLVVYPRVPVGIDDPYVPPPAGSGSLVATYTRTDRRALGPRSEALPNPDFSGAWSTSVVSSAPPSIRSAPPVASLGSGWGDRISIGHKANRLEIERIIFGPREMQGAVRYRYALDGSKTENVVLMGRTEPPPTSTTAWEGNRLVITTLYPYPDPEDNRWLTQKVTRTLWLQPAGGSPFEPSLVVETMRGGVLGGPASTNRTVYTRGYR